MADILAIGRHAVRSAMTVCMAAAAIACDNAGILKPQSGGMPYSVVILAADAETRQELATGLDAPVEGLPQKEKSFDVTTTGDTALTQVTRYARCIVVARRGKGNKPTIKYERDVYAKPQLLAYIELPPNNRPSESMKAVTGPLSRLINQFEINAETAALKRRHNPKGSKAVAEQTGCNILIPADMQSMKRGNDFIWLSNNAASGMQSICVYTYTGCDRSPQTLTAKRDSVMKANIPGEKEGMYMHTSRQAAIYTKTINVNGQPATELRGLWEMTGDAMGGPFVCHAVTDTLHRRTIVAEAFVYAPGKTKRNLIRQIEAALFTLRLP